MVDLSLSILDLVYEMKNLLHVFCSTFLLGVKPHAKLEKVVKGRILITDIQKLSPRDQTSSLESSIKSTAIMRQKQSTISMLRWKPGMLNSLLCGLCLSILRENHFRLILVGSVFDHGI